MLADRETEDSHNEAIGIPPQYSSRGHSFLSMPKPRPVYASTKLRSDSVFSVSLLNGRSCSSNSADCTSGFSWNHFCTTLSRSRLVTASRDMPW